MAKQTEEPSLAPAPQPQVELHIENADAAYANFCRVTGTPEELIIDFGLNAHPMTIEGVPVDVALRIVVNYFTAKRLLGALHMAVHRHESAFGVLETDVQKRVLPSVRQVGPAQG